MQKGVQLQGGFALDPLTRGSAWTALRWETLPADPRCHHVGPKLGPWIRQ